MPTYNVSMGQAVTVADLGQDSLVTGITTVNGNTERGRALASCTAVAMVNTRTGAAGLFHYPSGDINDLPDREGSDVTGPTDAQRSRAILAEMMYAINPNQVHFGHGRGLTAIGYTAVETQNANLPAQNAALRRFVQTLVPEGQQLTEYIHQVPGGAFLIRMRPGARTQSELDPSQFEVATQVDGGSLTVTDLSEMDAHDSEGYRLHGLRDSVQDTFDREAEWGFLRASRASGGEIGRTFLDAGSGGGGEIGRTFLDAGSGQGGDFTPQHIQGIDQLRQEVPRRHMRQLFKSAVKQIKKAARKVFRRD